MNRYCIKSEYQENSVIKTHDEVSGGSYWSPKRIESARYYQWPVYRFASSFIKHRAHLRRCVDVGCGPAIKLDWLARRHPSVEFIGVDQPSAISYCRERYPTGKWLAHDLEAPAVQASLAADLIICADVIEHLADPDKLLDYIRHHISAHGFVILSTPERDALRGRHSTSCPNEHHVREWNYEELRRYLRLRGFRLLKHFLQLPVAIGLSWITYNAVVRRALRGQPLRYNQVCVLQLESAPSTADSVGNSGDADAQPARCR